MAKKILVADDSQGVRRLIQRVLASCHYQVLSVSDGIEAVEMVQRERPDLILLDINMPKKNGREVIKELRRDIQTRMIPVIMITGDAGSLDEVREFVPGTDDCIAKPFDIMDLTARVNNMLEREQRTLSTDPLTLLSGSPV